MINIRCTNICFVALSYYIFKQPPYTYATIQSIARMNPDHNNKQGGLGWTSQGMAEYNNIWKWVRVDRHQRGAQFNAAFLNNYQITHVDKILRQKVRPKAKVIPFNGLDPPTLESLFPGEDLGKLQEF